MKHYSGVMYWFDWLTGLSLCLLSFLPQGCAKVKSSFKEEEAEGHRSRGPSKIVIAVMWPPSVFHQLLLCSADGPSTSPALPSPCSQQNQRYPWTREGKLCPTQTVQPPTVCVCSLSFLMEDTELQWLTSTHLLLWCLSAWFRASLDFGFLHVTLTLSNFLLKQLCWCMCKYGCVCMCMCLWGRDRFLPCRNAA